MRLTPNVNSRRTFSLSILNTPPWKWNDINSAEMKQWEISIEKSEKGNKNIKRTLRKWVSEIYSNL